MTDKIIPDEDVGMLLKQINSSIDKIECEERRKKGKGAQTKSCTHIDIYNDGKWLCKDRVYQKLLSEEVRLKVIDLLKKNCRHRDSIPGNPISYIFANRYLAGEMSGLSPHVDDALFGAVIVALTDDKKNEGLYLQDRFDESERKDVILRKGYGVAVNPAQMHGVHVCKRNVSRISLGFFFSNLPKQ